ncbi:uncharacterized protein LOC113999595 [Pipra filicauda]|uniref:Uncharacterized protein LOC113999595 n=1 Tax=Pipra filicauda TaxID=649802 RepID=A0A7R5KM71_9PASS|nr:uncharacterized protein LOC113999595 [Pipra filicauda]
MASAGRGGRVGGGARCGGGGSSRVSGRGADSGGRKGSGEGASRAEALPTSRPLCPEEEEAVAMAGAPRGDALAPRARAGGEGAPAAHTHGPLLPPGRTAQSQGSRRLIDASADQWRRPLKEVPWKGQRCQMYPDCESAVLEAERSSGTQLRTRCQGEQGVLEKLGGRFALDLVICLFSGLGLSTVCSLASRICSDFIVEFVPTDEQRGSPVYSQSQTAPLTMLRA